MARRAGGSIRSPSFWKYAAAGAAVALVICVLYFLFSFFIRFKP